MVLYVAGHLRELSDQDLSLGKLLAHVSAKLVVLEFSAVPTDREHPDLVLLVLIDADRAFFDILKAHAYTLLELRAVYHVSTRKSLVASAEVDEFSVA